MYSIIKHLHSGIRWLLLIALIWAIYDAYNKWKSSIAYNKEHSRPSFLAFVLAHTQLLIGIILFFITPRITQSEGMMKDKVMRFFAVEHPTMMLIALGLITIGYLQAKRNQNGLAFKKIFWYYLIALIIILVSIPWPFQQSTSGWF